MKKCRKCGKILDLQEFYQHAQMADGHLNFCKACVKRRVKAHRAKNVERIREYDRVRAKLPQAVERRKQYSKRWRANRPLANAAHCAVQRAVGDGRLVKPDCCTVCGRKKKLLAHHPDYALPLHVLWICYSCHSRIADPTPAPPL
jgi:hypothetical protein